eukprot:4829870-Alexandrium_andersonii.AAC.1
MFPTRSWAHLAELAQPGGGSLRALCRCKRGLRPGRLRTATGRHGRGQSCASGRRAIVAK